MGEAWSGTGGKDINLSSEQDYGDGYLWNESTVRRQESQGEIPICFEEDSFRVLAQGLKVYVPVTF